MLPESGPGLRVLIAPQEFKGSLTASEAAEAMTAGARRVVPAAEIDTLPLSDGGPGLVDALVAAEHGETRQVTAADPLGRAIAARFGLLNRGKTAVVELAAASGLSLLQDSERDPLQASSFGTGQVIEAALDAGARELIIGIGGSATNDGGAGMIEALGVRFLDGSGEPIARGGAGLARLERIDVTALDPRLRSIRIVAASDVRNPLLGPEGTSAVYGPQKGATPPMVAQLDAALAHYAAIIKRDLGKDVTELPGAGAAGGAGAALLAFLDASLRPGFELVADVTALSERLMRANLVLTGEGSLDQQTSFGKAVGGLVEMAASQRKPVIALAGILGSGYETLLSQGLTAAFSIVPGPISLDDARAHAREYLAARTEAVLRTAMAARALSGAAS